MRGGLLRHGSGLLAVALVGACSNIIGVSSYEIDPALDEESTSNGGKPSNGKGGQAGTETGGTEGGDSNATAGAETGGKAPLGGKGNAGSSMTGDAGMGGEPPVGCQKASDCDDAIDCTTDSCNPSGTCVHAPKDTLCDAAMCEACQVGLGCVAGPKTVMQLLVDPSFDLSSKDWIDAGDTSDNVTTVAGAQSGTKAAKFGPAPGNATEQEYNDLLQWVTIPEGIVSLTLTGYYKLTPGTIQLADDYVVLALYEDDGLEPFTQFHSFEATGGAQTAWKMFTYNAPRSEVADMGGIEFSFDLVAHTWDSVFQFDTLQLNATVCE